MTNYRISAPVRDFTGEVGGCAFAKGVYEGPVEPGPLHYFTNAGYSVEELDEVPAVPEPVKELPVVEPPAKSAKKEDWVKFAVEHRQADPAEADKLTHAQLVAAYGPKEEQQ